MLHSESIRCSEYLRDFLLLVGTDDSLIRVWDVQTGKLLHRLTGHSCDVTTLIAQKDGSRFISHSWNQPDFRLWDGITFTCLASFKSDQDIPKIISTRDGSRVVAGHITTESLVAWRLAGAGMTEEELSGEEEYEGEATTLTFTPLDESEFLEPDPDTEKTDSSCAKDDERLDGDLGNSEDNLNIKDFSLSESNTEKTYSSSDEDDESSDGYLGNSVDNLNFKDFSLSESDENVDLYG